MIIILIHFLYSHNFGLIRIIFEPRYVLHKNIHGLDFVNELNIDISDQKWHQCNLEQGLMRFAFFYWLLGQVFKTKTLRGVGVQLRARRS